MSPAPDLDASGAAVAVDKAFAKAVTALVGVDCGRRLSSDRALWSCSSSIPQRPLSLLHRKQIRL